MGTKETLLNFIDAAERSRKYPANTADAMRAALRLFEKNLNDEERSSIPIFQDHFLQIYNDVVRENLGKNFTAGSLETYKKRLKRLLSEYNQYGLDPTKMAKWEPKIRVVTRKRKEQRIPEDENEVPITPKYDQQHSSRNVEISHTVPLGPNRRAILIYPDDLTPSEAKRLEGYIGLDVKEN